MFSYEAFEVEVSTALNNFLATKTIVDEGITKLLSELVIAAPIPETQADFRKDADKTWIYVQYSGGNFDTTRSLQPVVVQDETVNVVINVLASKLRGETGIYTTLDHIKMCLLGKLPSNCQLPLTLQKIEQVQYDENQLLFTISFSTRTVAVQPDYSEPQIGFPQLIPNYIINTPNL